jgi:hypothetical protein
MRVIFLFIFLFFNKQVLAQSIQIELKLDSCVNLSDEIKFNFEIKNNSNESLWFCMDCLIFSNITIVAKDSSLIERHGSPEFPFSGDSCNVNNEFELIEGNSSKKIQFKCDFLRGYIFEYDKEYIFSYQYYNHTTKKRKSKIKTFLGVCPEINLLIRNCR